MTDLAERIAENTVPDLTSLFNELTAREFRLCNVFLSSTGWQCNVYGYDTQYVIGRGETAGEAAQNAITKALSTPPREKPVRKTISLVDLGLKQPFTRRI